MSSGAGDGSTPPEVASRTAEYTARNAADIAWLQESFAKAKATGDAGIMIIGQADPGFDKTGAPYNDVHWVKALVDPNSRDVFAFQAQTVPGNVVTHTP